MPLTFLHLVVAGPTPQKHQRYAPVGPDGLAAVKQDRGSGIGSGVGISRS